MSDNRSLSHFESDSTAVSTTPLNGTAEHVSAEQVRSGSGADERVIGPLQHRLKGTASGYVLEEDDEDVQHLLAHNFSKNKKWLILASISFLQISMNLNASIFGSANRDLRERFNVSEGTLQAAQGSFLIAYAFGCELWAPWSEETGRWRVLQWSLGLVNLWQIPQLAAILSSSPSQGMMLGNIIVPFRVFGGLCSAGGSVTLAIVADMWGRHQQQRPMAAMVWASVSGSIVGPVIGGFLDSFSQASWVVGVQLILGVVAQALQFFTPETRSSAILKKVARRRRANGEPAWTQEELDALHWRSKAYWRRAMKIWTRPFIMLATEPIVLALSLISGFSDALIFTFLEALPRVLEQFGFVPWQKGLCFLFIGAGYVAAWLVWNWEGRYWAKRPGALDARPEYRLRWLLWAAPLLPISMFLFSWLATPDIHWSVAGIFWFFIGVANYAIYAATVDYMVAAYSERYAASATGGNGFARDFLAGVSAFYAKPLYTNLGPKGKHLQLGSTLLAAIGAVLIVPIYVFYLYGQWVRARSKYAQEVAQTREATEPEKEPEVGSDSA